MIELIVIREVEHEPAPESCPYCGGTYAWDAWEQRYECDRCGDVQYYRVNQPEIMCE
jgi:predicted RNA-binding Zn-ribbon protein involved in translation (DUF1610 family)